jgi:hypothetical protein
MRGPARLRSLLPRLRSAMPSLGAYHLQADLVSLEEFRRMESEHPEYFGEAVERTIVSHVKLHGTRTNFMGWAGAGEVAMIGDQAREHLLDRGLNSRQRAMLDAILECLAARSIHDRDAKIYAHEAITHFALVMRGRFPKFIGTEFARDEQQRRELFPILHGDICNSDFPDAAFDVIVSNDVMEHVPDIDAALRESARILKPGGHFLATFPFWFNRAQGERYASFVNSELVHHTEPMYHGNPMDPDGGSLVFEIPGWDIIDRAVQAGFRRPVMRFIIDQSKGIVTSISAEGEQSRGVFLAMFDR